MTLAIKESGQKRILETKEGWDFVGLWVCLCVCFGQSSFIRFLNDRLLPTFPLLKSHYLIFGI